MIYNTNSKGAVYIINKSWYELKCNLKTWYEKDKRIIAACLGAGLVFTVCFGIYTKSYSDEIQGNISQSVIRYHVLANSNSQEDQALKVLVKDGILDALKEELGPSQSIEETRSFLGAHLQEVEAEAERIIAENGYDYPVTASLSQDYFPTKVYGEASFPAGVYEALRVEIGQGAGNNWWCVMFPPLCFVDITHNELTEETKNGLAHVLDEEAYDLVMNAESEEDIPVKIKFKIVEWWQNRENRSLYAGK